METDKELYTFPRARIIRKLKEHPEGLTKEKLAKKTKINRTSVLHHLKILEKRKLIKMSKPDKKKQGSPVFVSLTSKADPLTQKRLDMFEKIASLI